MPGYLGGADECFGVKIVSKYERPPGDPHGSHVGAVLLLDATSGLALALLEGGTLTAIRTAATTALATTALARLDCAGSRSSAPARRRCTTHARCYRCGHSASWWSGALAGIRAAALLERLGPQPGVRLGRARGARGAGARRRRLHRDLGEGARSCAVSGCRRACT